MNCGSCCITPEMILGMVKSALWGEMTAGHLQDPLKGCDGTPLGAAKVPTCDGMALAIEKAVKRMQPVIHDTTMSGYGTCQSPLTVNKSWLAAWVLDFADNNALVHAGGADGGIDGDGTLAKPFTIHVNHDASIDGIGTKTDPLKLHIQHDESLDGTGSEGDQLKVDTDWLTTQIKNYVDANGIHIAEDAGISGNGSKASPIRLNAQHDESLDGIGTKATPLKVDTDWLTTQIKNYVDANGGGHTGDGGGIDGDGSKENPYTLDIQHDNTLTGKGTTADPLKVVPGKLFPIGGDGVVPATNLVVDTDSVSTTIVGGQDQTLGRPSVYIQIGDYVVPAYAK